jgi:hypothetical protein
MQTQELNKIAVLNTGFLGLLESGKEIDCRVMDVSLEDIQATVLYFGGEIELTAHNYGTWIANEFFMFVRIQRGNSKIVLIHKFKNKIAYACQKEAFSFLSMWPSGTQFTIVDNAYFVA